MFCDFENYRAMDLEENFPQNYIYEKTAQSHTKYNTLDRNKLLLKLTAIH